MEKSRSTRYETFRKNSKDDIKINRTAIKLAVSIIIFAVVLLLKLSSPQIIDSVREDVLSILNANIDYKSAAAAFADGISGRKGIKDAATEVISYLSADEQDVQVHLPIDDHNDKNKTSSNIVTIPDDVTYLKTKDELVSAFKEEKKEFSDHELPLNTTYEMPDINLQYVLPAQGRFTSDFGFRDHPVDGKVKFHYGLDIGAEEGSEVLSFSDGTVSSVSDSNSYGLNITVTHANGVTTRYAHLSEILVESGDEVKIGDVIAKSGRTGNATGPCLHFEIRVNDVYVNPEYYLSFV